MKPRNKNTIFSEPLRKLNTASQVVFYSLALSNLTFIPYVSANPAGGNIVGGVGHIHSSALNTVIMNTIPGIHPLGHAEHVKVFSRKTFHQNSASLAIDWNSFNVGVDERVQFLQPDASSISLNRILDNSGSRILGRVNASKLSLT